MALVMSMGTAAFAADNASITINRDDSYETGATGNRTYTWYKVFHATYDSHSDSFTDTYDSETGDLTELQEDADDLASGVSYYLDATTDAAVIAKFNATGEGAQTWFTLTASASGDRYYVTWADDSDVSAATVQAAAAWILENEAYIGTDTFTASGETWTATGLEKGYYVIEGAGGKNLIAATTDVTIKEKNSYPTVEKEVTDDSLEVGTQAEYTITVAVPYDAVVGEYMYVTDTLDSHLAIVDSAGAIATSAANYAITAKLGESTTVSLADLEDRASEDAEDQKDHAFIVSTATWQKKFAITSAMLGQNVVITYKAELLDTDGTAVTAADTKYVNDVYLQYADYKTPTAETEVHTFDFQLKKTFDNTTKNDYEATFKLYKATATTADGKTTYAPVVETGATDPVAYNFIVDDTGYIVVDSNNTSTTDNSTYTDTIVVPGTATGVNVRGLDAGTYCLVEQSTQDGYNLLSDPVGIVIADTSAEDDSTISHTVNTNTSKDVTIDNQSGTVLPSTGGIGTTIFYVVGSILVVAAGVLLITKKRMSREG